MKDKKYLVFNEYKDDATRKTKKFAVHSVAGGVVGTITWHSPWRRYVFAPYQETIFDVGCMSEIGAFITILMDMRKKESYVAGIVRRSGG